MNKCEEKEPMSTLRITEESDIEFDLRTYDQEMEKGAKGESILKDYLTKETIKEKINESARISLIPTDDRYNEIYTR